jgi:hypothetical protein
MSTNLGINDMPPKASENNCFQLITVTHKCRIDPRTREVGNGILASTLSRITLRIRVRTSLLFVWAFSDTEQQLIFRITGVSDFIHRPDLIIITRKRRNTTFRKLDLFPSSGEGGHLFCWIPYKELTSITGQPCREH